MVEAMRRMMEGASLVSWVMVSDGDSDVRGRVTFMSRSSQTCAAPGVTRYSRRSTRRGMGCGGVRSVRRVLR